MAIPSPPILIRLDHITVPIARKHVRKENETKVTRDTLNSTQQNNSKTASTSSIKNKNKR